jgi:hypothetical protein
MTENFKQNYISTVAAALVAALPTRTSTKPARSRGMTANEVAASFNLEHEDEDEGPIETVPRKHAELDRSLVNNVLVAQMMQRQREV